MTSTDRILDEIRKVREENRSEREKAQQDREEIMSMVRGMKQLVEKIPQMAARMTELEEENKRLSQEIDSIRLQSNLEEQHQKAKNLILYGLPGQPGEPRSTTEQLVTKILSKLGIRYKVVMAHRLGQKNNSPVIVQFDCAPTAQEVFRHIRKCTDTSLAVLGLNGSGKVEVRYHLSTFLNELLRTAMIIKREANWAFCRPITRDQSIEMMKTREANSPKVVVHSITDLIELKNKLLKEGALQPTSPAANLTTETIQRPTRKRRLAADNGGRPAKR